MVAVSPPTGLTVDYSGQMVCGRTLLQPGFSVAAADDLKCFCADRSMKKSVKEQQIAKGFQAPLRNQPGLV